MNVSPLEEYGLRCAVQLAALNEGQALSAPEIAEREGLSVEYVSKFMLLLKRGGLVQTIRGIKGGFMLTRHPSQVRVKDVFSALRQQPREKPDFCSSYSGKSDACVRSKACTIRPFWQMLERHTDELTERTTLQDFLNTEEQTRAKVEGIAKTNQETSKVKELQS
jgi:Rrf2 family protein